MRFSLVVLFLVAGIFCLGVHLADAECTFKCAVSGTAAACTSDWKNFDEHYTYRTRTVVYTVDVNSTMGTTVTMSKCRGVSCGLYTFDDSGTNEITVEAGTELPDRDTLRGSIAQFQFKCTGSTAVLFTLSFYLTNKNDNQVSFGQEQYTASIPELSKADFVVPFDEVIELIDGDRDYESLELTLEDEPNVPFKLYTQWTSFNNNGKDDIEVWVKKPPAVDFERVRSYNLTLSVKDTQDGDFKNMVATTNLIITIEDLDDMDPVFNKTDATNYRASTTKGKLGVLDVNPPISAYDQDSLRVSIVYSIEGTSSDCSANSFKIDGASGEVNVTSVDLKPGECTIKLKAAQNDDELRFATAFLTVTINDVDDSCPRFPVTSVFGRIDPEDEVAYVEDGVEILVLNVTDDDIEFIGTTALTDTQLFELPDLKPNTNPQQLSFQVKPGSKLLDNEIYNLTVTVSAPNCSVAEANVTITVQNLSPEFSRTEYNASIDEGEVGSIIAKVSATSFGTERQITYILKSATNEGMDYFTIDGTTGVITVTSAVDAEQVEQFILFIEAQDKSWPTARISFAFVYVNVQDINDNSPTFTSALYNKSIPEDYAVDQEILTVTANDADKNDVLQYQIDETDLPFKINTETGGISVSKMLDVDGYVDQSEYTFAVNVSDGDPSHDQSVKVTICVEDVNDNPPVFDGQYSWFLLEEEEIVNETFQVSATDLDANSDIRYSLEDADSRFQILDDKVGNITVSGMFDREIKEIFEVIVEASDGENRATSKVMFYIQDVNDQPPVFNPSLCARPDLKISEDTELDGVVCQFLATDKDELGTENSNITYSVQNEEDFGIGKNGDVYELIVARPLDWETTPKYSFNIVATDAGVPPLNATLKVSLKITDVNDNAPVFEKSVMDRLLEESTSYEAGSLVTQLTVMDRDETKFYAFKTSGKDKDSFLVSATDSGCDVFVRRTLPVSSEPYILVIKVSNPGRLDLEDTRSTIRLRIYAGKIPCLEFLPQNPILTLTVPDSSALVNFTFKIIEMSVNYTCSGAPDLDDVEFGITLQSYREDLDSPTEEEIYLFTIDTSSGRLSCDSSASPGLYFIDLEVFNKTEGNDSISAYTKVELRLTPATNTAPVFSAREFSLPTQTLPQLKGTLIMDLANNVTDKDYPSFGNGEIEYKIISEECSGCTQPDLFQVTPSGELTLAVDLTLITRTVNITIMVKDRAVTPLNDTAVVSVEFRPPSTAPPVFFEECTTPIMINEELSAIQLVCSLKAVSSDGLPVVYGLKGDNLGNFTIDAQTGEIYTSRAFDYDTTDRRFDLFVYAKTTGSEGYTIVNVYVVDVNDHAPKFTQSEYIFQISEDTNLTDCDLSMDQWMVKATDDDATMINKDIQYSIVGGSEYFKIDSSTGMIRKRDCIDADNSNLTSSTMMMMINATNPDAERQLSTSVDVTFVVQDSNDNAPVFDPTDYIVRWPYFASSVEDVKQVKATDRDVSEYNSAISYSFAADQDAMVHQYFSIDSKKGIIRTKSLPVNGSIDLGEKTYIIIRVAARDMGSPPQVSEDSAKVTLIVDPTFGDEPYFNEENRQQETSIPENVINWCSGFSRPSIPDNPDVKVVYKIIGVIPEAELSKFSVNDTEEYSPKICNNIALDREITKEYVITVKAESCNTTVKRCMSTNNVRRRRETGGTKNGADFSIVVIRLFVSDVNDANPLIQKNFLTGTNKYIIAIPDNTPYGADIFQLLATDEDSMSTLEYTLVSDQDNLPKFSFIQSDGSLLLQDLLTLYLDDVNVDPAKEQASYNVTLRVTDSLTMDGANDKASTEVEAKIKVLYIFEYALLVVDKSPMDVESERTVLMDCLSKGLGFRLVPDRVEAHIVTEDGLPSTVDDKKSDVRVYAIDVNNNGGSFVKYWDVRKQWDSANSEVSKCSPGLSLQPLRAPAIAKHEYDLSMIVGVALLVLACFIGVASVVLIAAVIYLWDDVKLQGGRQISRKLDMLMLTENDELPFQFAAVNLAFEDDQSVDKASIAHVSEPESEVGVCRVSVAIGEDDELPQVEEEEPRYVTATIGTETVSPLQKGPEQYESQELVLDFEFEEDEAISSFAHIHTQEFNGEESQKNGDIDEMLIGADGQTESGDKSGDMGGDKSGDMGGDKSGDQSGDMEGDASGDQSGDKSGDQSGDKSDDISPGKADDKVDNMTDDKSGDTSHDKSDDYPHDKPDDKPQSGQTLPHKPSVSSTEGSSGNPNKEMTSKGPTQPTPSPPKPDPTDPKDPTTSTPETPKVVHFDMTEHVSDRSSSCASSDSTPMLDFAGGFEKVPDFLREVEVTEL